MGSELEGYKGGIVNIRHLVLYIYTDRFHFLWHDLLLPMFTLDEAMHICSANGAPIYNNASHYADDTEETD